MVRGGGSNRLATYTQCQLIAVGAIRALSEMTVDHARPLAELFVRYYQS